MKEWVISLTILAIVIVFIVLVSKMASDVRSLKEAIVG